MHSPNLTKELNELLLLARLREGPAHGYEIALSIEETSRGAFVLQHGTLYPILHRLEQEGFIEGRWDDSAGRRRKEYLLTPRGKAHLAGETDRLEALLREVLLFLRGPEPGRA